MGRYISVIGVDGVQIAVGVAGQVRGKIIVVDGSGEKTTIRIRDGDALTVDQQRGGGAGAACRA
jgi:hypothetical protein